LAVGTRGAHLRDHPKEAVMRARSWLLYALVTVALFGFGFGLAFAIPLPGLDESASVGASGR
jgi:hypothetical protein